MKKATAPRIGTQIMINDQTALAVPGSFLFLSLIRENSAKMIHPTSREKFITCRKVRITIVFNKTSQWIVKPMVNHFVHW